MLRPLLQYGAEPDAINPEGYTALHSIAATHNVDCALILLEWGADLNAVSTNGRTPLTTAIIYNNHPVLKLFVDRCYEYVATARLKGTSLPARFLHYQADPLVKVPNSCPSLRNTRTSRPWQFLRPRTISRCP